MSCDPKRFENMSLERFTALVAKAAAAGLNLSGRMGIVTLHGCDFQWSYLEEYGVLSITCTHKPFFVSCDAINQELGKLLD